MNNYQAQLGVPLHIGVAIAEAKLLDDKSMKFRYAIETNKGFNWEMKQDGSLS